MQNNIFRFGLLAFTVILIEIGMVSSVIAMPSTPTLVYPTSMETGIVLTPIFETKYKDSDNIPHQESIWRICSLQDLLCFSPLYDSGMVSDDLTRHAIPAGILSCGQSYKFSTSHKNNRDEVSNVVIVVFSTVDCDSNGIGGYGEDDLLDLEHQIEELIPGTDQQQVPVERVSSIVKEAEKIANELLPLNSGEAEALGNVADTALDIAWGDLGEKANVVVGDDVDPETLSLNPELLNMVIDKVSINVTLGMVLDIDDKQMTTDSTEILTELGVAADVHGDIIAAVLTSQPAVSNPNKVVIEQGLTIEEVTPATVVNETIVGDFKIEVTGVSETVGSLNFSVSNLEFDEAVSNGVGYIQETHLVSEFIPEGLHFNPDGTVLIIKDDVAVRVAPAPLDPVSLASAYLGRLAKDTSFVPADDIVQIFNDGRIWLSLANNAIIPGLKMEGDIMGGMDFFAGHPNYVAAGVTSFIVDGVDPASAAYMILVQYADGTVQNMPPALVMIDSVMAFLAKSFPGAASLDRATGVITLKDLGAWKPDYQIQAMTVDELAAFEAGKNVEFNLYYIGGDSNGDGVTDYWFFDGEYKQLLYGL